MPAGRPRNDAKHLHAAVTGLLSAIHGLVGSLGRASVQAAAPAPAAKQTAKRGPTKGNSKLQAAWANYTPAQRAARIAAMKAGHAKRKRALASQGGAKPARRVVKQASPAKPAPTARKVAKQAAPKQAAPKQAAPPKPAPAARKSAWASMSPEQRAERMAKMRAGRGGGTPAAR